MYRPAPSLQLPSDDAVLIEKIRSSVAEALDVPIDEVGIDDNLFEELGLDSLGTVMVLIDLAYDYGVPEPPRDFDFTTLHSVRALAAYARSFELETEGGE